MLRKSPFVPSFLSICIIKKFSIKKKSAALHQMPFLHLLRCPLFFFFHSVNYDVSH